MKTIRLDASGREEASEAILHFLEKLPHNARLSVYGAGYDYAFFLDNVKPLKSFIVNIIDDSGAPGTIPVNKAINAEYVIVCSFMRQESMLRKLEASGFSGTAVTPYKADKDIGTLGLSAYDPSTEWPRPAAFAPPSGKRPDRIKSILMVQPPFTTSNSRHKKTMPMGLLYIAGYLRKKFPGIEIKLFDAHITKASWDDMKNVLSSTDYDMLMLSYWSAQADTAFAISSFARSVSDAWIVHGGVHASLCPEESSEYSDVIIPFEGERLSAQLVESINNGRFEEFRRSLEGKGPDFIENLDELPFPAWEVLPQPMAYDHPLHVVGGHRFPILGSRGCPFNCTFCSSPLFWKRRVRWRSAENIVDEMDEISKRYGVTGFHFWDDNFIMKEDFASSLANEIIKRGRNYRWCGLSRASDIIRNSHLLPLLKKAGCVGIEIGVESFADQVSEAVEKGENTESTRNAAERLKASGIVPLYTHMAFTPGETIGTYRKKELFLEELNRGMKSSERSDSVLGQLATPHVKTKFAEEAPSIGTVIWRSRRDSFHHRINFIPDSLLDSIPERNADSMPDPLPLLELAVQAIIDWTRSDMISFIEAAKILWDSTDGRKSLRQIASAREKLLPYICTAAILWARQGMIKEAQ